MKKEETFVLDKFCKILNLKDFFIWKFYIKWTYIVMFLGATAAFLKCGCRPVFL